VVRAEAADRQVQGGGGELEAGTGSAGQPARKSTGAAAGGAAGRSRKPWRSIVMSSHSP